MIMASSMDNTTLREKLEEYGVNVGPINASTRQLYESKLQDLMDGAGAKKTKTTKSRKSKSPSRANVNSNTDRKSEFASMNDAELRDKLMELGVDVGPVTPTTRPLYEKKLRDLVSVNKQQLFQDDTDSKPSKSPPRSRKTRSITRTPTYSRTVDPSPDESYVEPTRTRRRSRNRKADLDPPPDEPNEEDTRSDNNTNSLFNYTRIKTNRNYENFNDSLPKGITSRGDYFVGPSPTHTPPRMTPLEHRKPAQTLSFTPIDSKYKLIRRSIHDNVLRYDSDEEIYGPRTRRYPTSNGQLRSKISAENIWISAKHCLRNSYVRGFILLFMILFALYYVWPFVAPSNKSPDSLRNHYPYCGISDDKDCIERSDVTAIHNLYQPVIDILKQQTEAYYCHYPSVVTPRLSTQEVLRRTAIKLNKPEHTLQKAFKNFLTVCIYNPHWNINVETNVAGVQAQVSEEVQFISETNPYVPLFCTIKTTLYSSAYWASAFILGISGTCLIVVSGLWLYRKKREENEQVNQVVQEIIDVLKSTKHQQPVNPWLPVSVIRNRIYPNREERALKETVWNKAHKIISEQESLITAGRGKFNGVEHEIWCWQGDVDNVIRRI